MESRYICDIIFKGEIDKKSYLNDIPAVRYLKKHKNLPIEGDITFFVGENGSGKSTLLEAIAVSYGFNAEGGTKNFSFSTKETHSELCEHITVAKEKFAKDGYFLRAESFYNAATYIDYLDSIETGAPQIIESYGGKSLHKQSHGESFLALVENRFGGNGVYILDEPEAALSPMKLLNLMVLINDCVKKDSQFIIATHSPILLAFPNADIYEFSQSGIERKEYKETEHYKITKLFLDNPERMLKHMLE